MPLTPLDVVTLPWHLPPRGAQSPASREGVPGAPRGARPQRGWRSLPRTGTAAGPPGGGGLRCWTTPHLLESRLLQLLPHTRYCPDR